MFVAVYRWRLKADHKETFVSEWKRITKLIRQECGSYGSALFDGEDGTQTAIALWPDRESRERCVVTTDQEMALMRSCVEEWFPEQRLQSVAMMWNLPTRDS